MSFEKLSTTVGHETITVDPSTVKEIGKVSTLAESISDKNTVLRRQDGQRTLAPKVDMDDGYFPPEIVKAHKQYIKTTEARINADPDEGKLAKDFEDFFIHGIRNGGWLGTNNTNGVQASAAQTCKYDDYKHRIDVFSTLYYHAVSKRDGKNHLYSPVIGMDVTISSKDSTLMDKLTRPSNDSGDSLPFGFSKLDYYTDGKEKKSGLLVPRYIVGISNYDVRDINQTIREKLNENGMRVKNFGLYNAKNMENQFKILSEIYSENELYLAMEPEERNTPDLTLANNRLVVVKRKIGEALKTSARQLAQSGYLKNIPETDSDLELISAIEERLMEDSKNYFKEEQDELIMHGKAVADDSYNDTYVQIMTCVKDLTTLAKDGKLDEFKGSMARNNGIKVDLISEMLGN